MISKFEGQGSQPALARPYTIAMAGCPNSGKSALFNSLTGSHQKVGNYPGVTVERKTGFIKSLQSFEGTINLIDLPGIYSLHPLSIDESISVQILKNQNDPTLDRVDGVLVVIDATQFEKGLGFLLEILQLRKPVIVALNMFDLATKRQFQIDLPLLEKELGVSVIPCVAINKSSVNHLTTELKKFAQRSLSAHPAPFQLVPTSETDDPIARKMAAKKIAQKVVKQSIGPSTWSKKLDRLLLHPVLGLPILAAILLLMFQAVFSWAEIPMEMIENGVQTLSNLLTKVLPEGMFLSLLTEGVVAGVGAVIVFLPQILILFFFINLLEATGYMMRAAYLMNRLMSYAGLQGQSFVPLLSSFACAIPGMMAARTVKNPQERLITIFIAPLMTCSARLPVYVLLISAFIPNTSIFGLFKLQGLVMFSLFIFGVLSAFTTAFVMKKRVLKSKKPPFLIELPSYKWPHPRQIAVNLWMRAKVFLKKAGGYILFVSVLLWALSSFPKAPPHESQLSYSIAGRIGTFIEPILRPVGFDTKIAIALVPGFAAREVLVSSLGTVFALDNEEGRAEGSEESSLESALVTQLATHYSLATALALLTWYIFAPQCLATFAVMKRETNGWKWPLISFSYLLFVAYISAWAVFQTTSWMMS